MGYMGGDTKSCNKCTACNESEHTYKIIEYMYAKENDKYICWKAQSSESLDQFSKLVKLASLMLEIGLWHVTGLKMLHFHRCKSQATAKLQDRHE